MKKCTMMIAAMIAAAMLACTTAGLHAADDDRPASLFTRLGGMPAVNAVVDDFVARILVDERVNKWFAHAASTPEDARAYKSSSPISFVRGPADHATIPAPIC